MIASPHPASGLSKAVWTDADFTGTGWHDCGVHAISVGGYEDDTLRPGRLLLDLDYIVRWVEPSWEELLFTHWISPATLVFEPAGELNREDGARSCRIEDADASSDSVLIALCPS